MTNQPKKLILVELDQEIPGYRKFISAWLWRSEELTFVVDPGPRSTVAHLIAILHEQNIQHLDFVLLTHIHLDHGGGAAELLDAYPMARVYCHPKGEPHLADPTRLWSGSRQVLGSIADVYGEPRGIPMERFTDFSELARHSIRTIETPGHAPHHVSFVAEDVCFVGEALGTTIRLPSGAPYLRPATPPRFFSEQALASIKLLEQLEPEPRRVAFAHFGETGDLRTWCRRAHSQLELWLNAAREVAALEPAQREAAFFERLQREDPLYGQGRYGELPRDLRARERHFLGNTLAGLLDTFNE